MLAKDRHKITLIEYIGNWDNEFPSRTKMAEIVGIKKHTLWKHYTPAEMSEIENEGLELRKKNSARQRDRVYASMLSTAEDGNTTAQKEFLDRTEGKIPDKIKHGIDASALSLIFSQLPVEYAEKVKKELSK